MRSGDALAADLLRRGAPLRIKARGGSMLPFLRDGDVALVMPAVGTEIGVGDVICYETAAGRLFLHRVIEHRRGGFVGKGDAPPFTQCVDPGEGLGRGVAVPRGGGGKRGEYRHGPE